MRSWTLRYSHDDYAIVTPPPVLDTNGGRHARLIRLHHVELHKALQGKTIWPPEEVAIPLYSEFALYYRKVAALLNPPLDTDALDPISRHLFLVCTDPTQHPETQQWVPGLSGLEQIMGYSYTFSGDGVAEPQLTTGDTELDLLTDALLIFKRNGLRLAQMLGMEDLGKVCKQASDRMRQANEQGEEAVETAPELPDVEDERFVQHQEQINQMLQQEGVWMPLDR